MYVLYREGGGVWIMNVWHIIILFVGFVFIYL